MTTESQVLSALQPFGLKEAGDHKWRCNSPFRPGSNSHAFSLTIDDPEHGAYIDHVSGETGSLYDLAKRLEIPLPAKPTIESTKRMYKGIEDYAAAHGVSAGVFESAGWHEVRQDNRPALAIPTASGTRWRFLDGEKPIYKSPYNYNRCWYGLRRAVDMANYIDKPLVICNGEASTVVGQEYALPVCAVSAGEQASLPEYLLAELQKHFPTGRIIVAFDSDHAGREKAPGLAEQLRSAGYDCQAVDLGLDVGGDVADLCKLHGAEAEKVLLGLPTLDRRPGLSDSSRRWRIVPLIDLKNLPETTWLVEGIVPEAGLCALYGGSGEGKSFYALDLSMQVAREKSVIYIAAEGELGYRKRAAAWCQHYKVSEDALRIAFCMGSVSLLDDQDKQDFIDALSEYKPALVVVDTVAQTMLGGDENSTRDMGLYLSACRDIMRTHGCSVMLIHHTGKGRLDERGSSALRASCDVMVRLSAEDDLIRIECSKTKDESPFETRHMQLLPVGESVVIIPSGKIVHQAGDPLTKNQRSILDVLAMPINTDGISPTDIEALVAVSHGVALRAINRLIELEFAHRPDRGLYQITSNGLRAFREMTQMTHLTHLTQGDGEGGGGSESTDRVSQPINASTDGAPGESMGESMGESIAPVADQTAPLFADQSQKPESYYRNGG